MIRASAVVFRRKEDPGCYVVRYYRSSCNTKKKSVAPVQYEDDCMGLNSKVLVWSREEDSVTYRKLILTAKTVDIRGAPFFELRSTAPIGGTFLQLVDRAERDASFSLKA